MGGSQQSEKSYAKAKRAQTVCSGTDSVAEAERTGEGGGADS